MTQTEVRQAQFLDLLYDHDRERPGRVPSVVELLGEQYNPSDEHVWRGIVRELDYKGLIKLSETMGFSGTGAMITGSGREDVEARRARRNNTVRRSAFARDAVVRYLHGKGVVVDLLRGILLSPELYYEGLPLTEDDLAKAEQYLFEKGLVRGQHQGNGRLYTIVLTSDGIDCIEHFGGSVSDYLRPVRASGNTTVNFNGNVSGSNVAWQNTGGVNMTANAGVSGDQLAELVGALKQALPVLGLGEADVSKLTGQLEVAEDELGGGQPDAGVVKSIMKRTLGKIGEVGTTALGMVLTAVVKDLMQKAGLPLD